MRIFAYLGGSG